MRIGIVAYWFNRGQGVVARQLRSALTNLGHETFVLARPTRKTNIRPDWIDREGVWAQQRVTAASDYLVPWSEYEAWAESTQPDLVLFDQNYQFEEIAQLRRSGVRTAGRFVWEHFAEEHVAPAGEAFDAVYSLTACERERYKTMGIDSPRVRWGCHPELLQFAESAVRAAPAVHDFPSSSTPSSGGSGREAEHSPGNDPSVQDFPSSSTPSSGQTGREAEDLPGVVYLFPGGFMSKRKPLASTIEAFRGAQGDNLRLLLKSQVERQSKKVERLARGGRRFGRRDRRIEVVTEDLPTDAYLRMLASADVCLAPSRWEGLGLHLFEATALGVPTVTNDNPPMNEVVLDGVNGLLVPGIRDGTAPRSGIPAFKPDVAALTAAIERLADDGLRSELAAGARRRREELNWETTRADLAELVARVAPASAERRR